MTPPSSTTSPSRLRAPSRLAGRSTLAARDGLGGNALSRANARQRTRLAASTDTNDNDKRPNVFEVRSAAASSRVQARRNRLNRRPNATTTAVTSAGAILSKHRTRRNRFDTGDELPDTNPIASVSAETSSNMTVSKNEASEIDGMIRDSCFDVTEPSVSAATGKRLPRSEGRVPSARTGGPSNRTNRFARTNTAAAAARAAGAAAPPNRLTSDETASDTTPRRSTRPSLDRASVGSNRSIPAKSSAQRAGSSVRNPQRRTSAKKQELTPSEMRQQAARRRREQMQQSQEASSTEKKRRNMGTPRTPRQRLMDRGFDLDAPEASPHNSKPRRLTGGDGTPSSQRRQSIARRNRPSLPSDTEVARRLDVDQAPSFTTRSLLPRSTASRAKAMNAIAESTIGSARMDTADMDTVVATEQPMEHVVPRTPKKHRGALESFRRTRRASQEAEMASKEEEKLAADSEEEKEVETPKKDREEPTGALGEGWNSSGEVETPKRRGEKRLVAAELMTEELVRRGCGRFSEGAVTLSGVSKLRESLGRRRSRGGQDLQEIAPPQLRRKSLKLGQVQPLSVGFARLSVAGDGGVGVGARAPLGSIGRNQSGKNEQRKKETSRLKPFSLNDDTLAWANSELEDDLLSS